MVKLNSCNQVKGTQHCSEELILVLYQFQDDDTYYYEYPYYEDMDLGGKTTTPEPKPDEVAGPVAAVEEVRTR